MINSKHLYPLLTLLFLLAPTALLAEEPVSKSFFGGIAIDGHNTVAYHRPASIESNKAIKGDSKWSVQWKGATWLFTSAQERDSFGANPEKYSPAYNGHCANALSLGEGLVKTDGQHWQIFANQLYTFYAPSGRKRWLVGDFKDYKKIADKAWEEIIK